MAKLDPRLLANTYFTALTLGVVEEPTEMAFLSKEQAEMTSEGIYEQMKRRNEIKKAVQDMLKILTTPKEAPNEKPIG